MKYSVHRALAMLKTTKARIERELSDKEVEVLTSIAINNLVEVKKIKDALNIKPNEFSVYRDRLLKKGILDGSRRGILSFALPFFDEYVREHVT